MLSLISTWSYPGPVFTALGVHPAAWSRDPVSCMTAPAGLSRLESLRILASAGLSGGNGSYAAAAGMPLGEGRFSAGAGAMWSGPEEKAVLQLSGSYVLTGDPVGFMEGLYGPSIAGGLAISAGYHRPEEGFHGDITAGAQISLFPSFALGLNCSEIIESPSWRAGFSHVFNRNMLLHVSYGEGRWEGGAELTVTPGMKVFSGTDGNALGAGISCAVSDYAVAYGARLHSGSIDHSFGIERRFRP